MRLCQCVTERRREQDQPAGSSLDSQKGGNKIRQGPEDGALSTFGGKVRVCGSIMFRAPLGSRGRPWRTWTPALGKSPDFRNTSITSNKDFTAL